MLKSPIAWDSVVLKWQWFGSYEATDSKGGPSTQGDYRKTSLNQRAKGEVPRKMGVRLILKGSSVMGSWCKGKNPFQRPVG